VSTYTEYLYELKAMQSKADAAKQSELDEIKARITAAGFTSADLGFEPVGKTTQKAPRKSSVPAAPKYRDPATGATWTGRGPRPKWIVAHFSQYGDLGALAISPIQPASPAHSEAAPRVF
jgi:DNA-binding protein H-NS